MVLMRSGWRAWPLSLGLSLTNVEPRNSTAGLAQLQVVLNPPPPQVLPGIHELPAWKMRSSRLFSVGLQLPGGWSRGQSRAPAAQIVLSNSAFR